MVLFPGFFSGETFMTKTDLRRVDRVSKINAEHKALEGAIGDAVRHARNAGKLLNEQKALTNHGGWGNWVSENCDFSLRTAQLYMQIFENWHYLKAQGVTHLSLSGARKSLLTTAKKSLKRQGQKHEWEAERAEREQNAPKERPTFETTKRTRIYPNTCNDWPEYRYIQKGEHISIEARRFGYEESWIGFSFLEERYWVRSGDVTPSCENWEDYKGIEFVFGNRDVPHVYWPKRDLTIRQAPDEDSPVVGSWPKKKMIDTANLTKVIDNPEVGWFGGIWGEVTWLYLDGDGELPEGYVQWNEESIGASTGRFKGATIVNPLSDNGTVEKAREQAGEMVELSDVVRLTRTLSRYLDQAEKIVSSVDSDRQPEVYGFLDKKLGDLVGQLKRIRKALPVSEH
jgi:hypothetical protein